ncbi:hypothetical protein AJ87_35500 [Rhizobium yanglingense]|nr:hypothetical protein AJ87_35500 [Rhizobium yanglingense]
MGQPQNEPFMINFHAANEVFSMFLIVATLKEANMPSTALRSYRENTVRLIRETNFRSVATYFAVLVAMFISVAVLGHLLLRT